MPAKLAPSCRVGRGPSARWTTTATDMTTSRPLGLDGLTDPVRSMVSPALQRSEEVLESATAVGCTLVLTDRRLMLVREGTQHRPRTGVQTWTLDRTLTIRLSSSRERARVLIECCGQAVSVFVAAVHAAAIRRLVVDARERIYSEEAPADPS